MLKKDYGQSVMKGFPPRRGDIWVDKETYDIGVVDSVAPIYAAHKQVWNYQMNMIFVDAKHCLDYVGIEKGFFFGGKNKASAKNAITYHQIDKINEALYER